MENKNVGIFTAYNNGTRPLNELYQLVLDNFDLIPYKHGICGKINHLFWWDEISPEESKILQKNFNKNKPKWYNSLFWYHRSYTGRGYWWKSTKEGDKQRKLFLQYLIKKYS